MNRYRLGFTTSILVPVLVMAVVAVAEMPMRGALAQGIGQASYSGVTFSYDRSLASNVQGHTVASNVGRGASLWEIRPEHMNFTFDGYPVEGMASPQIRVIPLAEYKSIQMGSSVSGELSELERYLGGETGRLLPLLPPVNAKRIINEKVASVAGTGISGVRFVASYAQGPTPVSADNITYMFIGITTDGMYYVDGVFPLSLSNPLDPAPSPATVDSAQAYNQAVAERLRNTEASGFTPNLDNLDKMMMSIRVNKAVIPGMPTTGAGEPEYELATFVLLTLATALLAAGLAVVIRAKVRP